MVRVLFICLGNICRSPTAQGVFREIVAKQAPDLAVETDSAGTGAWHIGLPPDERARETASLHNIDIGDLRARRVGKDDFARFDYILAMDSENLAALQALCPPEHQHKLRLFLEFASATGLRDVPDPYYGDGNGFEKVFQLVESAAQGLLQQLLADQQAHTE